MRSRRLHYRRRRAGAEEEIPVEPAIPVEEIEIPAEAAGEEIPAVAAEEEIPVEAVEEIPEDDDSSAEDSDIEMEEINICFAPNNGDDSDYCSDFQDEEDNGARLAEYVEFD